MAIGGAAIGAKIYKWKKRSVASFIFHSAFINYVNVGYSAYLYCKALFTFSLWTITPECNDLSVIEYSAIAAN